MMIQLKIIAALLSVLALGAALLLFGHREYNRGIQTATDHYEAALGRQKTDAAQLLASETAKVLQVNLALQQATQKQELQDAKNKTTIADLADRLRAAAGPAGRLRDPNAAGCGGSGDSAPSDFASAASGGADDGAEAGGLLSGQLTGLLRRLTREADDINAAYVACRADAYTVRGAAPP